MMRWTTATRSSLKQIKPKTAVMKNYRFLIFDWGDTLMRDSPARTDAMYLWSSVEVVEGAEEALRHLQKNRTIALATNAAQSDEEGIRRALVRGGLDGYIEKIYCFKNSGYKKPSPEFYHYILRDLGARPCEALMIGDGFENDVLGANSVGIYALWLNEQSAENRTGDLYQTIHSLRELIQLLG